MESRYKITMNDRPDIVTAIQSNDGYCPCTVSKTEDYKCPCKDFRNMFEGDCHCGLYHKEIKPSPFKPRTTSGLWDEGT